jgi:lipid-A-disaccharide synthase
MKYYIIAGEASGDLHASCLMRRLKECDTGAEFRAIGGDLMEREGAALLCHYRDMAYMGFLPVITHLGTILGNMDRCKRDIDAFSPDAVILVDYPGFNLKIARHVKRHCRIPVFYYISPKIWAWKTYRVKSIKKYVDGMFSILPFEKEFYDSYGYGINYVGNPTLNEVKAFENTYTETAGEFRRRHGLGNGKILALLAGSRKQEIHKNLPQMLQAAEMLGTHQVVIAGAPGIDRDFYEPYLEAGRMKCKVIFGETYPILAQADMAAVTSGTATLETAVFRVPQVVCYKMEAGRMAAIMKRLVIKVKYISLVNLIAGREVVKELVAHMPTARNIYACLKELDGDTPARREMLAGYDAVAERLGNGDAAGNAARAMTDVLAKRML